ncbi:MAG: RHS repeat-associated core domain-containing protein [Planctomycetota bacterium]
MTLIQTMRKCARALGVVAMTFAATGAVAETCSPLPADPYAFPECYDDVTTLIVPGVYGFVPSSYGAQTLTDAEHHEQLLRMLKSVDVNENNPTGLDPVALAAVVDEYDSQMVTGGGTFRTSASDDCSPIKGPNEGPVVQNFPDGDVFRLVAEMYSVDDDREYINWLLRVSDIYPCPEPNPPGPPDCECCECPDADLLNCFECGGCIDISAFGSCNEIVNGFDPFKNLNGFPRRCARFIDGKCVAQCVDIPNTNSSCDAYYIIDKMALPQEDLFLTGWKVEDDPYGPGCYVIPDGPGPRDDCPVCEDDGSGNSGGSGNPGNNEGSGGGELAGDAYPGALGMEGGPDYPTCNPVLSAQGIKSETEADIVVPLPGRDFVISRHLTGGLLNATGAAISVGPGWYLSVDSVMDTYSHQRAETNTAIVQTFATYPDHYTLTAVPGQASTKFIDPRLGFATQGAHHDLDATPGGWDGLARPLVSDGKAFRPLTARPEYVYREAVNSASGSSFDYLVHVVPGDIATYYIGLDGRFFSSTTGQFEDPEFNRPYNRIKKQIDAYGNQFLYQYIERSSGDDTQFFLGSIVCIPSGIGAFGGASTEIKFEWDFGSDSNRGTNRVKEIRVERRHSSLGSQPVVTQRVRYLNSLMTHRTINDFAPEMGQSPGDEDPALPITATWAPLYPNARVQNESFPKKLAGLVLVEKSRLLNAPTPGVDSSVNDPGAPQYHKTYQVYRYNDSDLQSETGGQLRIEYGPEAIERFAETEFQTGGLLAGVTPMLRSDETDVAQARVRFAALYIALEHQDAAATLSDGRKLRDIASKEMTYYGRNDTLADAWGWASDEGRSLEGRIMTQIVRGGCGCGGSGGDDSVFTEVYRYGSTPNGYDFQPIIENPTADELDRLLSRNIKNIAVTEIFQFHGACVASPGSGGQINVTERATSSPASLYRSTHNYSLSLRLRSFSTDMTGGNDNGQITIPSSVIAGQGVEEQVDQFTVAVETREYDQGVVTRSWPTVHAFDDRAKLPTATYNPSVVDEIKLNPIVGVSGGGSLPGAPRIMLLNKGGDELLYDVIFRVRGGGLINVNQYDELGRVVRTARSVGPARETGSGDDVGYVAGELASVPGALPTGGVAAGGRVVMETAYLRNVGSNGPETMLGRTDLPTSTTTYDGYSGFASDQANVTQYQYAFSSTAADPLREMTRQTINVSGNGTTSFGDMFGTGHASIEPASGQYSTITEFHSFGDPEWVATMSGRNILFPEYSVTAFEYDKLTGVAVQTRRNENVSIGASNRFSEGGALSSVTVPNMAGLTRIAQDETGAVTTFDYSMSTRRDIGAMADSPVSYFTMTQYPQQVIAGAGGDPGVNPVASAWESYAEQNSGPITRQWASAAFNVLQSSRYRVTSELVGVPVTTSNILLEDVPGIGTLPATIQGWEAAAGDPLIEIARAEHEYDSGGQLTTSRNFFDLSAGLAGQYTETYKYDSFARLIEHTDGYGNVHVTEYDVLDRVISTHTKPAGNLGLKEKEVRTYYDVPFATLLSGVVADMDDRTFEGDGNPTVISTKVSPSETRWKLQGFDEFNRLKFETPAIGDSSGTPFDANSTLTFGPVSVFAVDNLDRTVAHASLAVALGYLSALDSELYSGFTSTVTGLTADEILSYNRSWFDQRGIVLRTEVAERPHVATWTEATTLVNHNFTDLAGNTIATLGPSGALAVTDYDGLERPIKKTVLDGYTLRTTSPTSWFSTPTAIDAAFASTSNLDFESTEYVYDANANVVLREISRLRRHDLQEYTTPGVAPSASEAGDTYVTMITDSLHDAAARPIATVSYGIGTLGVDTFQTGTAFSEMLPWNTNSAWQSQAIRFDKSTDVLGITLDGTAIAEADVRVTQMAYDERGLAYKAIQADQEEPGPGARTTQRSVTLYDDLGRATVSIASSDDSIPYPVEPNGIVSGPADVGNDVNVVTIMGYDAGSNITTRSAVIPDGSGSVDPQTTRFHYTFQSSTTPLGSDPQARRSGLLYGIDYPVPGTGLPSNLAEDQVRHGYNVLGEQIATRDQNGTTRTFVLDPLGRIIDDQAVQGTDVDGLVDSQRTFYDQFGRVLSKSAVSTNGPLPDVRSSVNYTFDTDRKYLKKLTQFMSPAAGELSPVFGEITFGKLYGTAPGVPDQLRVRNTGVQYPSGARVIYDYGDDTNADDYTLPSTFALDWNGTTPASFGAGSSAVPGSFVDRVSRLRVLDTTQSNLLAVDDMAMVGADVDDKAPLSQTIAGYEFLGLATTAISRLLPNDHPDDTFYDAGIGSKEILASDRTAAVSGMRSSNANWDPASGPAQYPGWDRFGRLQLLTWAPRSFEEFPTLPTSVPTERPWPDHQIGYTWDDDNNLLAMNDMRASTQSGIDSSRSMTYDALDRLASEDRRRYLGSTPRAETSSINRTMSHDAVGNTVSSAQVLTNTSGGTTTSTLTVDFDLSNEVTGSGATTAPTDNNAGDTEACYDANGNLIRIAFRPSFDDASSTAPNVNVSAAKNAVVYRFAYDAWNRLVQADVLDPVPSGDICTATGNWQLVARYDYNALGWRTAAYVASSPGATTGESTLFFYDDQWRIVEERIARSYDTLASPAAAAAAHSQAAQQFWGKRALDEPLMRRIEQIDRVAVGYNWSALEHYFHVTDHLNSTVAMLEAYADEPESSRVRTSEVVYYDEWGTPHLGMNVDDGVRFGSIDGDDITDLQQRFIVGDRSADFTAPWGLVDLDDIDEFLFRQSLAGQRTVGIGGGVLSIDRFDEPYTTPPSALAQDQWLFGPSNRFGYAGYVYLPEIGMYLARNRVYDPSMHRWMQRDPAGYVDGMSLYAYSQIDPYGMYDPYGLFGCPYPGFGMTYSGGAVRGPSDTDEFRQWQSTVRGVQEDFFTWENTDGHLFTGTGMPSLGGGEISGNQQSGDYGPSIINTMVTDPVFDLLAGDPIEMALTGASLVASPAVRSGSALFRSGTRVDNLVDSARPQVRRNKASGDAVRDIIAAREAPALTEQVFRTGGGRVRRVDVVKLGTETVGIESKVGETALRTRIKQELARDWWLKREGKLDRVVWEFSRSKETGLVGPTGPLQKKLDKLGMETRINP